MKAVVYHAVGDIRFEDVPEPRILAPTDAIVRITASAICGTDLHEYLEGPIFCPKPGHPHPITGEEPPVTLGHEFSGVVAALGEGVDDLEVGQHVVVEPYVLPDDVKDLAEVVWAHRLVMDPDAEFTGATASGVITAALAQVPAPTTRD